MTSVEQQWQQQSEQRRRIVKIDVAASVQSDNSPRGPMVLGDAAAVFQEA